MLLKLLVIFAAFNGYISGTKDARISINPYYNLYIFSCVLIDISTNVFVAYYLPWVYMSYHIICYLVEKKFWKKLYKKEHRN
jgi:hypothetical protein